MSGHLTLAAALVKFHLVDVDTLSVRVVCESGTDRLTFRMVADGVASLPFPRELVITLVGAVPPESPVSVEHCATVPVHSQPCSRQEALALRGEPPDVIAIYNTHRLDTHDLDLLAQLHMPVLLTPD